MSFVDRKLKTNENLIAVIYKHWFFFFVPSLISIIILFLDFFFMFPLFDLGLPGQIIFYLALAIGLILLLRLLIRIKYNLSIITSERIIRIIQKGFFHRQVTEIEITSIIEASYRTKGIWQTILRYGTVLLRIKDSKRPLIIKHIRKPSQIQQLILNVQKMSKFFEDES